MPGRLRKFVIHTDAQGAWRWTLYAPGDQKVAESTTGFASKEECLQSVRSVPVLAFGARIWNEDTHSWEG